MNKEYDGFSDSVNDAERAHAAPDFGQDTRPAAPTHSDSPAVTQATSNPAAPRPDDAQISAAQSIEPIQHKKSSTTAGLWLALILGAILLIMLLIFVVQNNTPASFDYFTWTFNLPLGVAMLCAAVAGALIMALVGSVRMAQLGWQVRRYRKQQDKVQSALRR